jgi:polar amino acid transport system substrate-binding protein
MKKVTVVMLIALLIFSVLSVPALAGDQGELGRLTKLNVDEDTLSEAITESYFDLVPFSRYRFFDNLNSMIAALASGRIAGMALDEYTAQYLLSRAGEFAIYTPDETVPSYNLNFSMLLREEDAALCNRISETIEAMKADGTLDALKKQYIDDVITGEDPEAVTLERFDGAQTLKVAVTGDRPPMDYFSEAGEPIGFNTALVAEIGKRLGMNVEFISIDTGARGITLTSGLSDAIFWMEAGDYGNWAKADVEDQPENTIVTSPYLTGAYTLVVPASSPLAESNEK